MEIPELDGDEISDAESTKSVRMEMVEVIKLHMSLDLPEGRHLLFLSSNAKGLNKGMKFEIFLS